MSQTALQSALEGNPRLWQVLAELETVESRLGLPAVYENRPRWSGLSPSTRSCSKNTPARRRRLPGPRPQLLLGLGLPEGDLEKPLSVLSGGQKNWSGWRACCCLGPSVLLLDEPDNHLDLPGKTYLEKLIREYPGVVVIVSHDRYLLDAVVTHIAEIEDGKISTFSGDYSSYMLDKEERLARQEELYGVQQREIGRMESAIKRLALWGKIYDNEKFAQRAKAMQNRLDKMDKIDKPITERRRMDLKLSGWRGSNKVLDLIDLHKVLWPAPHPGWRRRDSLAWRTRRVDWPQRFRQIRLNAPAVGKRNARRGRNSHRAERQGRLLCPGARNPRFQPDRARRRPLRRAT
jgi:ATP-binding cassette, subfamily F, member 3